MATRFIDDATPAPAATAAAAPHPARTWPHRQDPARMLHPAAPHAKHARPPAPDERPRTLARTTFQPLFSALVRHALPPRGAALIGPAGRWSHARVLEEMHAWSERLRMAGVRMLATRMDNSPEWVVADLACLDADIVHVPLPAAFTPAQLSAVLQATGADGLLTYHRETGGSALPGFLPTQTLGPMLALYQRAATPVPLPAGTRKIAFATEPPGPPRGVCLDAAAMLAAARAAADIAREHGIARHLNALPFAMLLENMAGVYACLLAGATCITLPISQIGLPGTAAFAPDVLHQALVQYQANSVILLPPMLRAYIDWLRRTDMRVPPDLALVAVGPPAGAALLADARAAGLPVRAGYPLPDTIALPHAA